MGGQVSIDDFPGIYDYYRRYVKNWQHEQMAAHYRNTIISILKEYDNNQNSDDLYNAIAWTGLTGTVAWNNLTEQEKIAIANKVNDFEQNGDKNCPQ